MKSSQVFLVCCCCGGGVFVAVVFGCSLVVCFVALIMTFTRLNIVRVNFG